MRIEVCLFAGYGVWLSMARDLGTLSLPARRRISGRTGESWATLREADPMIPPTCRCWGALCCAVRVRRRPGSFVLDRSQAQGVLETTRAGGGDLPDVCRTEFWDRGSALVAVKSISADAMNWHSMRPRAMSDNARGAPYYPTQSPP